MRAPILVRLLLATLPPTVLTFAGFGLWAHYAAERSLEAELGVRLTAVAQAAALSLRGERVDLLRPGDESSRSYRNVRRKLVDLRAATSVARIYAFDPARTALAGSDEGVPIGARLYALDADVSEIRAALGGQASSSILFLGRDGRRYKSGFAPLRVDDSDPSDPDAGKVVAVVGVDGAASLFEQLGDLRRTLLGTAAVGVLAVVLLSVLVARRITRPVRQLVEAARVMGAGDLDKPIAASSSDEIGFLAETLEEMRRELRARDERLQLMLAGIAHEVRNPLAGMELFAGLLRDDLAGPEQADQLDKVRRIERELGHLRTLVSDFLDYARRPPPDLRDTDVAELLREVAQVLAADGATRDPPVVVAVAVAVADSAVAGTPSRARLDAAQIRRVLFNLGRNALQALEGGVGGGGGGGGKVVLALEGDEGWVQLRVTDNGRGIRPEHQGRLFQPFFTTREQGTGLGLALCAETAAAHGGTVAVASVPGQGASFTLRLPRRGPSREPTGGGTLGGPWRPS